MALELRDLRSGGDAGQNETLAGSDCKPALALQKGSYAENLPEMQMDFLPAKKEALPGMRD